MTLTSQTLSGVVGTDQVSLVVGAVNFADKNVGTNKLVLGTNLSLSGGDATNYALGTNEVSMTASISPAALTVSASASDKIYDGTSTATVSLTDNHIGQDDVEDSDTAANFASQNVGLQTVTVSGIAISGADAGNYTANRYVLLRRRIARVIVPARGCAGAVPMEATNDVAARL